MEKKIPFIRSLNTESNFFDFKNTNFLSKEEELILTENFKEKNDLFSVKKLVDSNLKFIIKVARRYEGYGLALKDLIQEGVVGFLKSLKKFDSSKNIRLISFSIYWIKSEIHEYIIRNLRIVRIASTKSQKKLFFNLRKIKKSDWLNENEIKVIANLLNVQISDIKYMESRLEKKDSSFDIDSNNNFNLNDNFFFHYENDFFFELEESNFKSFLFKKLRNALQKLDERSKDILKDRWLLERKKTLKELSKKYNLSQERIRQLEKNALKKVKYFMNLDCL